MLTSIYMSSKLLSGLGNFLPSLFVITFLAFPFFRWWFNMLDTSEVTFRYVSGSAWHFQSGLYRFIWIFDGMGNGCEHAGCTEWVPNDTILKVSSEFLLRCSRSMMMDCLAKISDARRFSGLDRFFWILQGFIQVRPKYANEMCKHARTSERERGWRKVEEPLCRWSSGKKFVRCFVPVKIFNDIRHTNVNQHCCLLRNGLMGMLEKWSPIKLMNGKLALTWLPIVRQVKLFEEPCKTSRPVLVSGLIIMEIGLDGVFVAFRLM